MSSIKRQISQLKKDFYNYEKNIPIITLNNGKEIKVVSKDLLSALCSIGTSNEHRIVKEMRGKQIIGYTGKGNMPELIKSLIDSFDLRYSK